VGWRRNNQLATSKQEQQLCDELNSVDVDILERIGVVIDSKWQAPVIQSEIEELYIARDKLFEELRSTGFFEKPD